MNSSFPLLPSVFLPCLFCFSPLQLGRGRHCLFQAGKRDPKVSSSLLHRMAKRESVHRYLFPVSLVVRQPPGDLVSPVCTHVPVQSMHMQVYTCPGRYKRVRRWGRCTGVHVLNGLHPFAKIEQQNFNGWGRREDYIWSPEDSNYFQLFLPCQDSKTQIYEIEYNERIPGDLVPGLFPPWELSLTFPSALTLFHSNFHITYSFCMSSYQFKVHLNGKNFPLLKGTASSS